MDGHGGQIAKAQLREPRSKLTPSQQKNAAGRDAFEEAVFAGEGKEEVAGWIEGYVWKAEGGKDEKEEPTEQTEEVTLKMGDTSGEGAVTEEVDLSAHTEALKVEDK